jgi:hypothetical protein
MSDRRLSDLSILAIERDLAIDYEKIVDAFTGVGGKRRKGKRRKRKI